MKYKKINLTQFNNVQYAKKITKKCQENRILSAYLSTKCSKT